MNFNQEDESWSHGRHIDTLFRGPWDGTSRPGTVLDNDIITGVSVWLPIFVMEEFLKDDVTGELTCDIT